MNVVDGFVDMFASPGDGSPWAVGTISAVTPGGAVDGNALVSVTWQGASVRVAYASSYTPVVGHVVLMARVGPRLVIVCRVIGTPPNT